MMAKHPQAQGLHPRPLSLTRDVCSILERSMARVGVIEDLDKNDDLMMPNRVIMT